MGPSLPTTDLQQPLQGVRAFRHCSTSITQPQTLQSRKAKKLQACLVNVPRLSTRLLALTVTTSVTLCNIRYYFNLSVCFAFDALLPQTFRQHLQLTPIPRDFRLSSKTRQQALFGTDNHLHISSYRARRALRGSCGHAERTPPKVWPSGQTVIVQMDENIANFVAITGAPEDRAAQFLQLSDGNLESAIQLYFESPELAPAATSQAPPVPPASSRPGATSSRRYQEDDDGIVHIPSDDEADEAFEMTEEEPDRQPRVQAHADVDSDAEMARRLQEEFYGTGGGVDVDPDGYRAPIQRTTETLVGPDADWGTDPDDMQSAIAQQLRMREQASRRSMLSDLDLTRIRK